MEKCPNGHASVSDGMCNIASCAHVDPSVTKKKKKNGISFGTARDYKVGRWAPEKRWL